MKDPFDSVKGKMKTVLISALKKIIIVVVVIGGIIALLAASTYFITIDDGTYKEDDWGNTNYGASQYINEVGVSTVDTSGTGSQELKSNISVQELWETMIQNGCRVDKYLSSPEELSILMKAEIATKFPDIRSNPDEEIDWEKVIEDEECMQGIIKFIRSNENNQKTTMKYTDPDTFQSYLDDYNINGSETAKNNALTHFTLKKGVTTQAGTLQVIDGVSMSVIEDNGRITFYNGDGSAQEGGENDAHGKKLEDGKCALKGLRASAPYNSVIYIETRSSGEGSYANGKFFYVADTGGGLNSNQVDVYANVSKSQLNSSPYGSYNGARISLVKTDVTWEEYKAQYYGKTLGTGSSSENSEQTNNNSNTQRTEKAVATVTSVSGADGYNQEYTSSAGFTYKHYKQGIYSNFDVSWSDQDYWNGHISGEGCGPTSIAILSSGLQNSTLTPGDIAKEMQETNYETLKKEMDSLGMQSEVVHSPTSKQIQDYLKDGKVMLVSVNSNTKFTNNRHIMAIVDINTAGQVYVCNPSSKGEGWQDVGEITKGCNYIVVTDAGAAGVARTTASESGYVAVVASWTQIDTTIETNDPLVKAESTTEYIMSSTEVNYQEMTSGFTMPFDMLWAFMVVGEDKDFVFDLANLVYNSDIQITIHDNLTVNTVIDDWNYKQRTKGECEYNITADCQYDSGISFSTVYVPDEHPHICEPHGEDVPYNTKKTVVTQTDTISPVLTKADVWCMEYTNEYKYSTPSGSTQNDRVEKEDTEYKEIKDDPNYPSDKFECEHIDVEAIKAILDERIKENATNRGYEYDEVQLKLKTTYGEHYDAKYFNKYIEISDDITNITEKKEYTQGTPDIKEKTDANSDKPNFVTIFLDEKNTDNRKNVLSVSSWLFEIIENNQSTADSLDLIKYLLYKATGKSYGVTTFDMEQYLNRNLSSVGGGDYIVHIEKSSKDIVITDLATLKKAFNGYKGDEELQEYANFFLECQKEYKVNAVFAAAVSITETSAGRNGNAVNGRNNWFNIKCVSKKGEHKNHGEYEEYDSVEKSIEKFFWQIAEGSHYFKKGNYTVSSIGNIFCENASQPDGWNENTNAYMTQMFEAAGINVNAGLAETEIGAKIVKAVQSKIGCNYVWGATGPNTFDCSGLTQYCYKQAGISIPRTSGAQKSGAIKKVSVSQARVGDVLWKQGHVAIYIGNGQLIEAPGRGKQVKISNNVNRFTWALQFY